MAAETLLRGSDGSTAAPGKPRFRGDVDGLRAIAILLVVGFHIGLPGFGGGFIGVDVFFVISGFLITRNLLAEVERTRRVRLLSFWAGRIRRLVPALSLTVVATLIASLFVLPRINWQQIGTQGMAAALYVSNLLFARDAQDYFAPDINQSPFLHTWSLGVEEQFYLLWPLLFAGVCWLVARRARRHDDDLRTALIAAFSILFVVSFIWNLRLSASGSSWAFFGLPTRAWEFAVAGLLAAIPLPRALHGHSLRTALSLVGLGVLGVATLIVEQTANYPGLWAVLPVGATLLVVASGDTAAGAATPIGSALGVGPMQWLGRVSYSWYLWHWPFIVLVAAAVGSNSLSYKLAAAVVSLPVAFAAHRLVENPLRFSRRLIGSRRLTYGVGAIVTVMVVVVAGGVVRAANIDDQPLDAKLADAKADLRQYECNISMTGANGAQYCVSGQVDAPRTVMLIGDSHARHWKIAVAAAANDVGVRLVDRYRGTCPAVDVRISQGYLQNGDMAACDQFQKQSFELIDELHPDVVIVSDDAAYEPRIRTDDGKTPSVPERVQIWRDAYRRLIQVLRDRHATPLAFIDNPQSLTDPLECISKQQAIDPCAFSRDAGLASIKDIEEAEDQDRAAAGPITTFSVQDVICPPGQDKCNLEIGGRLVFADGSHLTSAFTLSQVPKLERVLRSALP